MTVGQRLRERGRGDVDVLVQDRGVVVGVEGGVTGEHAIEQHAERVDIDAGVDGLALDLLGREIVDGADDLLRRDLALAGDQLGHAEVEDLDEVGAPLADAQHHVAGLDVAVHQPARVGVAEALEDLRGDRHEVLDAQTATLAREVGAERLAVEVLHRQVRDPVLAPALVQADDVRVLKRVETLTLALEAGDSLGVVDPVGREHLDDDLAVRVALVCEVHQADATAREQATDRVVPGKGRPQQRVLGGGPLPNWRACCGLVVIGIGTRPNVRARVHGSAGREACLARRGARGSQPPGATRAQRGCRRRWNDVHEPGTRRHRAGPRDACSACRAWQPETTKPPRANRRGL
jgi:hypothetical protein